MENAIYPERQNEQLMRNSVTGSSLGWISGRAAYAIGACVLLLALLQASAITAHASTPPTVPSNVQVSAGTTSPLIATVTWSASTDDIGVTGYRVWRAVTSTATPTLIGSTVGLRFDDITGVAGQNYFYAVSAFDGSGLESTRSAMAGPVRSTWVPQPHTTFAVAQNTCKQCHVPHQAATQRGLLRNTGAPPSEASVCYSCHDGSAATTNIRTGPQNSFALASGHAVEERLTGADLTDRCSSCHEVHAHYSANRMLPGRVINGVAVTRGNSWCFACHNNTNDWFGPGYPSPATPSKDASGYPVSGRFFGPTVYNNAALNAHASIPATIFPATSTPATATLFRQRGDCLFCHESHRSANKYDALRGTYRPPTPATLASDQAAGTYAEACFACHGGVTQSYFTTRPVNIRQFVVNSSPALTVNAGHRVETPGGTLPVGSPLPCYNCHNPHGSTRGNASLISDERGRLLETSTAAGVRAFCLTCHATTDGFVWNSVTATYTAVSTTETVEGLRRDGTGGNMLRFPPADGHNRADTQSCYACHGRDYAPGGFNVHNPSGGGSAGGMACYPCHAFRDFMEDGTGAQVGARRTENFHHVLGGAAGDGDRAFPFGSYPTSTTDVYCLSCHVDHDRFNANNAANLRTSLAASADGTNTDFIATTGGICIGCHSVQLPKDFVNRRDDGTRWTPTITAAVYGASAHSYVVTSTFGDGTTFRGDCSKCHTDRQPKLYQTGTNRFGLHWDPSRRILAALGRGVVSDPFAEERFCFSCHSLAADGMKPVAGRDWFGSAGRSMSTTSQNTFREFTSSTARLFFKPAREESVTGNVSTGDQGQTYAGGTWRVRSMSPATSSVAFESFDTATVAVSTGTQNWRRVRFVSPAVAATVSVPAATWTVSIFSREDNAAANAFMLPFIYVWRADNLTRVNIVAPTRIGVEFVTTALPGGVQTVATPAGTAVELRPGDKVVMDLAVRTDTVTAAGSYAMTYSWGFGAQGSLLAPATITWQVPVFGHRVAAFQGLSRPSLMDETPAYLSANRHVECEDCHNPHAAGNVSRAWAGANTNRIGANSPLAGVFGRAPSYPATTADSATLASRWVTPTAYSTVVTSTFEYQICFRCHSGANPGFIENWGPTDPAKTWTNVALEFNPDNAAFHPVVSRVNTTAAPGRSRIPRQTTHMRAPWNRPPAEGGVGVQTMQCSDCHRSNIMTATSQGPHGSAIRHLLRGTWPTRRADGEGVNPSADMWWLAAGADYTGLLCNVCHNMDVVDDLFEAHTRGGHRGNPNGICINCHITIPHGGALHGFIGDGGGAVSTMPARYAYQGNKAMMEMWTYGGDPNQRNGCLTDGTGPCGQHSGETGPFWNW